MEWVVRRVSANIMNETQDGSVDVTVSKEDTTWVSGSM